jgi:Spy/CpxP family protein refolding chaperone
MNKPNPIKALVLTLVPVSLLLAPVSLAEGAPPHKATPSVSANRDQDSQPCMFSQLNLSKEQAQKVKSIMAEGHKQGQPLKAQVRTKKHALMQYIQSPDASLPQALNQNSEINNLQRQLGELRLKTFFSMRAQLTPEQLDKLQHLQKESPQKHGMEGRNGQQCGTHHRHGGPEHTP